MQTHDSNVRPSVRNESDNRPTPPTPQGRIDWALLILTCTRIAAVAWLVWLVWQLYGYAQIAPDPVSLLPSVGQFLMAGFFAFLVLTTPKRIQGINALFLVGLVGVVVIF